MNMFPDNQLASFILANPRKRKVYECIKVMVITDFSQPVFCIDVGNARDMDEEEKAVCEECERDAENLTGQMEIADFPEVMP